jgi:hypothetical protein
MKDPKPYLFIARYNDMMSVDFDCLGGKCHGGALVHQTLLLFLSGSVVTEMQVLVWSPEGQAAYADLPIAEAIKVLEEQIRLQEAAS